MAAYLGAIGVVTAIFLIGPLPEPRGFWIEFGALLGLVVLVMLCLQFVLTGRYQGIGRPFGIDIIIQFHRHAGMLLLVAFLAHPLILMASRQEYWEYFDPRVNFLRSLFLAIASLAMALLVVLSLWRTALGITYEWWRLSHGLLAAVVVFVGVVHSWQVGHYVDGPLKRGCLVLLGASTLGSLAYVRLYRPWRAKGRPYRVVEVVEERGESTTLVMEPVGHSGLVFRGGQFAWLTIGETPFTLQQHPFSFSSSDSVSPGRLEFTAKRLGDFTASLQEISVGTVAFLEGPFGEFVLDDDAPGAFFIMGGIGVTPAISILRAMRDRGDTRPALLIYGSTNWNETVFRKELDRLSRESPLRIVYVLSDAGPEWEGEVGYIDRELLTRYIGERERTYSYFICGPEPMLDSAEKALLELGIPLVQTRAERFDFV
jgi:predicted ferric reductase